MNTEQGEAFAAELGPSRARFWQCDVSDTDSIAAAVEGVAAWVGETGVPLGGVVPAAGVGNPALVCLSLSLSHTHTFTQGHLWMQCLLMVW